MNQFGVVLSKCTVREDVIPLETIKVPFIEHLVHGH